MSPEIINGFEIDLPTDIFSLGIIFVEIFCRRLVDSKTFIVCFHSVQPNPSRRQTLTCSACPRHSRWTKPKCGAVPHPAALPP